MAANQPWLGIPVVCGFLVAITGCSETPPLPPADDPVFATVYDQAVAARASDEQLAILRRVTAAEEVAYADVSEALSSTFTCFEASGVGYFEDGTFLTSAGLPFPNYSWGGGLSEEDMNRLSDLGDACLTKHSYFVELLYNVQPTAVEAESAGFEARRTHIIECLAGQGLRVDDDATRAEIEAAVSATVQPAITQASSGASMQADNVLACFSAGL